MLRKIYKAPKKKHHEKNDLPWQNLGLPSIYHDKPCFTIVFHSFERMLVYCVFECFYLFFLFFLKLHKVFSHQNLHSSVQLNKFDSFHRRGLCIFSQKENTYSVKRINHTIIVYTNYSPLRRIARIHFWYLHPLHLIIFHSSCKHPTSSTQYSSTQ